MKLWPLGLIDGGQLLHLNHRIFLLKFLIFRNENLVMPPKPNDARKKLAFYNIDFSLEHQVCWNLKND